MVNREYSDDGWDLPPPVAKRKRFHIWNDSLSSAPPIMYREPQRSVAEPPASIILSQPEPVRESVVDNGPAQIVTATIQHNYSCIPDVAFAPEQFAKKPASVASDHYLAAENQQESIHINREN